MRRLGLIFSLVAALAAAFAVGATADDKRTYLIEMYNAFGIVEGSDVRVAGVNVGSVQDLEVNSEKRAVIEVEMSGPLGVLGSETTCTSDPQSLIAEYSLDCDPRGPQIDSSDDPENPDVPAQRVEQTVQPDLVQNTLREPFKRRLQLLINEFGTALAGNAENLNEAIRLGAPALRETEKVLSVLASQNRIIRDLNVDSDKIIARLAERRDDVVAFIQEARDTAVASSERRDDLSRDFALLDDFLAELRPTLAELEVLAREQTPLLTDLRASASGLNRLVLNLPAFNAATEVSLDSLGEAGQVGQRALRNGREEIEALADAGRNATSTAEMLADFLRDIDDPRRIVEEDTRAADDTGKPDRVGYKGLEGLLNYGYYQAGSLNQFDQIGHLLHFSLYYIFSGPCGRFTTGRDFVDDEGTPGLPDVTPGTATTTTNILDLEPCIGWTGPNQPGINEDLGLPPYPGGPDPPECTDNPSLPQCHSVCPAGTEPEAAEAICDPAGARRASSGGGGERQNRSGGEGSGGGQIPGLPGGLPNNIDDLLDLPPRIRNQLPDRLQDRLRNLGNRQGGGGGGGGGNGGGGGGGGGGANDLLDFLLGP